MPRGPGLAPYIRSRICELKRSVKWGAKRIQEYAFPNIPLSTMHYTLRQDTKRCHGLTEEDRDRVYDAIQNNPSVTREDLLAEVDYKFNALRANQPQNAQVFIYVYGYAVDH
ncbi:hypothetical protein N7475_000233 [Penicillium sp. IBT 31633x]|nr:hypothetical protein N7475_000233 [Penicillium sp. IBT 31633x]